MIISYLEILTGETLHIENHHDQQFPFTIITVLMNNFNNNDDDDDFDNNNYNNNNNNSVFM